MARADLGIRGVHHGRRAGAVRGVAGGEARDGKGEAVTDDTRDALLIAVAAILQSKCEIGSREAMALRLLLLQAERERANPPEAR